MRGLSRRFLNGATVFQQRCTVAILIHEFGEKHYLRKLILREASQPLSSASSLVSCFKLNGEWSNEQDGETISRSLPMVFAAFA